MKDYKKILIISITTLISIFCNACTNKIENINISSDNYSSGWYYIFICKNSKKFDTPDENGFFHFNKKIVMIDEKLVSEKMKFNIYRKEKLYNDSCLFFAQHDMTDESTGINKLIYYCFYIPNDSQEINTLKNDFHFPSNEHFKQNDFLVKTIVENEIK